MLRKFAVLTAALSLGVGSVAGAAAVQPRVEPARVERAAAPVDQSQELRGTTAWILAAIALGLIIWGAIELFDDGTDAFPVSP